jgi:spore coat protein A
MDVTRRQVLGLGAAMGVIGLMPPAHARALAALTPQLPLPGSSIPQFINPLPLLGDNGIPIVNSSQATLYMREFQTFVLPPGFIQGSDGTWVYGYRLQDQGAAAPYIGPVIVASRGTPTAVRWVNELGSPSESKSLVWLTGSDQTLHWADPLHDEANQCAHDIVAGQPPAGYCAMNYDGPIPAVAHLHGGEVPPVLDGGPDAWFTQTGLRGHAYYSGRPVGDGDAAVYRYPNTQEAAPLWFHDHVLGGTRLNVYAGLAGAYVLTDPDLDLPPGLHPVGLQQGTNARTVDYLVPLVIQDRSFDTNGQFLIPNVGLNPEHPFWVPEFVGDTIVVNGKVWPFLNVEPRRYRFLVINGSNARAYELFLTNPVTKVNGPVIWQIGTDGGYLDAPAKIDPNAPKPAITKLTILPGERADLIVDFSGFENQTLVLRNTGRHPYPKGDAPQGSTTGQVMVFRVGSGPVPDTSYDPVSGVALHPAMVRLADPVAGTLAAGVTPGVTRQLTLNEVLGPGGPLEILLNNTTWDGDADAHPEFTPIGNGEYVSEFPTEGATEVWEIVNLTADAHPIHVHLTQVQLLNRQAFNVNKYSKAYAGAFPSGVYTPRFGPPLNYATGEPTSGPGPSGNTRALGGNPDIVPFLQGPVQPPDPNEAGWKDTIRMLPGEVTRFVVRYCPTDVAAGDAGNYPFDPDAGEHGFVWHCHIIDHEDNEMMRPYRVDANDVPRDYVMGTDY